MSFTSQRTNSVPASVFSGHNYPLGIPAFSTVQIMQRPGFIHNPNGGHPRLPAGVIPYYLAATAPNNLQGATPDNRQPTSAAQQVPQTPIRPPVPSSHAGYHATRSATSVVAAAAAAATSATGGVTLLPDKPGPSHVLNPNMVSANTLAQYAMAIPKCPTASLVEQFLPVRRVEAEAAIVKGVNSDLCARDAFGIYSESPFLRPVALLREVRFAAPANLVFQYPDPDNMVRTLRDLADQRVASKPLLALISGSKPTALSLGFHTDYMIHVFNVELDLNLIGFLNEQARSSNSKSDQYRVVLRLGWATQGLYLPNSPHNPNRALAAEVLPRSLSVRVARRNVVLPDPIFHGGQATKLGHRLKFAIDITDKIPARAANMVRSRNVEIELSWVHAPLEDHAQSLLEVVGSGYCSPIMNHLINLPLVQVTLDRVQTIPEFVREFSVAVAGKPCSDHLPNPVTQNGQPKFTPQQLYGCYDFCTSTDKVISVVKTLAMIKEKLSSDDDLLCDNWIPVTLLCPLTLTRIEVPVRGIHCDHLQCYDLASYLSINKRRPRWTCPVCSGPAPFRDLRRDDFFKQLLMDKSLGDAERLQVDAQGSWRRAADTTGELERDGTTLREPPNHTSKYNKPREDNNGRDNLTNGGGLLTPVKTDHPTTTSTISAAGDVSSRPIGSPCVVILDSDEEEEQQKQQQQQQQQQAQVEEDEELAAIKRAAAALSRNSTSGPTASQLGASKSAVTSALPLLSAPPTGPAHCLSQLLAVNSTSSLFVDLTGSSDEEGSAPTATTAVVPAPPSPRNSSAPVVVSPSPLRPPPPPLPVIHHQQQPQNPSASSSSSGTNRPILVIPAAASSIPTSTATIPRVPGAAAPSNLDGLVPFVTAPRSNAVADLNARLIESLTSHTGRIVFLSSTTSTTVPSGGGGAVVSTAAPPSVTVTTTTATRPTTAIRPPPNTATTLVGVKRPSPPTVPSSATTGVVTGRSNGSGRFKVTVKRKCNAVMSPSSSPQEADSAASTTNISQGAAVEPTSGRKPSFTTAADSGNNRHRNTSTSRGSSVSSSSRSSDRPRAIRPQPHNTVTTGSPATTSTANSSKPRTPVLAIPTTSSSTSSVRRRKRVFTQDFLENSSRSKSSEEEGGSSEDADGSGDSDDDDDDEEWRPSMSAASGGNPSSSTSSAAATAAAKRHQTARRGTRRR